MNAWLYRLIALAAPFMAAAPAIAAEIHVERSLYRNVYVNDDGEQRCMLFRRTLGVQRQSCLDLKQPDRMVFDYTKMLLAALYLRPDPKRVLMIGLGAGIMPRALEKILPEVQIDVVELDPAVVRVARQYFDFRPGPRMQVVEEDGRVFVRRAALLARARYDLVILDAFDHEYIPEHLLTREFLTEVRNVLAPDGVLAANTFSISRLYDNESVTYEDVFGPFYNLRNNNRVILLKRDGLPPMEIMRRNAVAFEAAFTPFDAPADQLLKLFSTERNWRTDARVLTDKFSPSNLLNTR